MGVTVLPDWGAQLGKALSQLGSGIADIKDPYLDFKDKFKQADISSGGKLSQGLTDYNYINGYIPSAISRMIPKDLLNAALINEPSPNALKEHEAQRAFRALSGSQRVSLGQGTLLGTSPANAAVQLRVPDVINQVPGTVPQTLSEAGAQRLVSGMSAGSEAADAIKAGMAPAAQTWLNLTQQYDAEHGTNYYLRTAAQAYDLLQDEQWRMTLQDRMALMNERQQDRLDVLHEHEANWWLNKSGGLGSPDLWKKLLYDPKMQDRLDSIRQTGPKTAEDRDLWQMQLYREGAGSNAERASYMASVVTRDKMIEYINGNPSKRTPPDDDSRRPGDIAALNAELIRENTPFEAYWGKSPDGSGDTQLRFRSRAHKQLEVTPDQIYVGLQQADRKFTGQNLQVQIPRTQGQGAPAPKPTGTVTSDSSRTRQAPSQAVPDEAAIRRRVVEIRGQMFPGKSQLSPAEAQAVKERIKAEFPGVILQ